jgi:hypothetical protein
MRHSEDGLYNALEKALRESKQPLDCVQLFDIPEVKEHAASANRVSDYLGNLWRRGEVVRLPGGGTANSRARWSYQWKKNPLGAKSTPAAGIEYTPRLLVDRPTAVITEEGKTIHIETPHLTIIIKQRD